MWEMVDRHFEEAEFLAERWRDEFDAADITLTELALGTEQAPTSLALVASLGVLALGELDDCRRLLALLDASEPDDERWTGIVEALALSHRIGLEAWLRERLHEEAPARAGVATALARRQTSLGSELDLLLASNDPHVLAAAATLARHGDPKQLERTIALAHHEHAQVAMAAAETALIRGVAGAIETTRHWAFDATISPSGVRPSRELSSTARLWLGVLGQPADQQRLLALLDDPSNRRDALWALGFGGRVDTIEAVLPLLEDPELGPLAGEVMMGIVGLPTDDESLWRERDERDELPPLLAERFDAPLIGDPTQLLPIPEPAAVLAWWRTHGPSFDRSARLLAGVPLDDAVLAQALVQQPMRRRHPLALLAQNRNPSVVQVSTRAWAHIQLRYLVEPELVMGHVRGAAPTMPMRLSPAAGSRALVAWPPRRPGTRPRSPARVSPPPGSYRRVPSPSAATRPPHGSWDR
jgi:uncharacterized protein (TIGR02270 family)